jgi:hypothetical protein
MGEGRVLEQEDHELETSLRYLLRPSPKTKHKKIKRTSAKQESSTTEPSLLLHYHRKRSINKTYRGAARTK